MSEKIPEPNSLDSMEGVPRQDIPVVFAEQHEVEIPVVQEKTSSAALDPVEKAERVKISDAEKATGVIRFPPSFYREMILISYRNGDKETLDKFRKAVTMEEKAVIEKDALRQSEASFQQFSGVVSSLDFAKGDLKVLHDALEKPYDALSEAMSELHVIELVSGSGSNRRELLRFLDKAHLLVSDLRWACQGEAYRQQHSLWVRMFSKDRSKIIALSEVLTDYQQGIEKAYGAFSGGEDLDHETAARLLIPMWPRPGFESGK